MKNKVYKIIVISFFIALLSLMILGSLKGREIDKYGKTIIGKFVFYKSYPKSSNCYFIYYLKGIKYYESSVRAPAGFRYNIGKFYKIKYFEKYPKAIHPLYDQEVTDTSEILKAGFSMDELLNKKRNDLFPVQQREYPNGEDM